MENEAEEFDAFLQKFRRDLNRVLDSDRATRKRGLQKLLEALPWSSEKEQYFLKKLLIEHLLDIVLVAVSDSVEKCREISLQLLKKIFEVCTDIDFQHTEKTIQVASARINDVPFPEVAEELRLQVVELLSLIMKHPSCAQMTPSLIELVLQSLSRALTDNFASVKRECANLVHYLSKKHPFNVRMTFKSILKPLAANGMHQHAKTRSSTLKVLHTTYPNPSAHSYQTIATAGHWARINVCVGRVRSVNGGASVALASAHCRGPKRQHTPRARQVVSGGAEWKGGSRGGSTGG